LASLLLFKSTGVSSRQSGCVSRSAETQDSYQGIASAMPKNDSAMLFWKGAASSRAA